MGYHRAGFVPYGIDSDPKPLRHYPFPYICMDALEAMDKLLIGKGLTFSNGETLYLKDFDAYHASPPCQNDSRIRMLTIAQGKAKKYPRLIIPTRKCLITTGKPYVIENVPGAPLINPVMLCGSSFGLKVRRHRLFEANYPMLQLPCAHYWQGKEPLPPLHRLQGNSRVVGCYGNGRGKGDNKALWSEAMGITWMTRKEMSQAIPPIYIELHIGKYLIQYLEAKKG
jgi:DNA (cytosine-5)-methyltransferase 1